MNTRNAALTLATAAAIAAALTGCNPAADAGPITSATKASTSTSSSSVTPVPSTSTTLDPAAKEAKDRQDAEAVWRQFNALIGTVESLPADQVDAAINTVAVEPSLTRLRDENAQFRAEHKAGYGQVVPYITWPQPIDGKDTAVFNDCQDWSQAGVLDTKTSNKLTVGTANTPILATVQRTPQGWRVAKAELLQGGKCTPGQ
jgi:hypothetical protein